MPDTLHLIQILGFELMVCGPFCGTICNGLNVCARACVCMWVCVCVFVQCLCLDIADVMEAFGKCSLVYNNSRSLLTIRQCRQIAVTQRCLYGNYQAITAECR